MSPEKFRSPSPSPTIAISIPPATVFSREYELKDEQVRFLLVIPAYGVPGQVITNVGGNPDISFVVPPDCRPGDEIILVTPNMRAKKHRSNRSTSSIETARTVDSEDGDIYFV